jgi:hypothetical protein
MTDLMNNVNPPEWGDPLLRLFLKPADRDSVSGDLLEEYREMVLGGRDRAAADRWYLRQVAGFLWRATWAWAVVLALLNIGRFAVDVFVPPASWATRSAGTTYAHIVIFMAVGFQAAWRRRSLADSVAESHVARVELAIEKIADSGAAAISVWVTALLMIFAATGAFLAIWHDPQTLANIEGSGGFEELVLLPIIMMGPAVLLAMLGGAASLILPRAR